MAPPAHRLDDSSSRGPTLSLSPYDNFDPTRETFNMKLLLPPESKPLTTPDSNRIEEMTTKGLIHTHPSALRSTSFMNTNLDVVSSPTTVFAPSMLAAIGKLPNTNLQEEEEDPKKARAKPRAKSPKGKDKQKKARRGPVDPQVVEQIFPVLSVEQEVPSIMRMQQMQQVEAIRETFARHGMSIPTSVIEQGILTPEDRPYMECITNLPLPDDGLVKDFTKKKEKKKKPKKAKSSEDKKAKK
eukprot:NODE_6588_length_867_cov_77.857527_g5992_i0.p1 GENE.NODE_6588_length_867_cov_77.857527_g5992_i0~~NODE_6588_length_867_cov_77.857527_g5992_i0.p1  ORF type:complete len:271 (+),score=86.19 NODE_6588_length_867_cov_77.857527_g5992_i0:88-813(+)